MIPCRLPDEGPTIKVAAQCLSYDTYTDSQRNPGYRRPEKEAVQIAWSSKRKDEDIKQSWELHARYNRLFITLPLPVLPIRDYQHALPSSFKVCIFDTLLHNIELLIHSWYIQKHYWVNLLYPTIEHQGNAKTNKIPPKGSWFHSDENNYHTVLLQSAWEKEMQLRNAQDEPFTQRQGADS